MRAHTVPAEGDDAGIDLDGIAPADARDWLGRMLLIREFESTAARWPFGRDPRRHALVRRPGGGRGRQTRRSARRTWWPARTAATTTPWPRA